MNPDLPTASFVSRPCLCGGLFGPAAAKSDAWVVVWMRGENEIGNTVLNARTGPLTIEDMRSVAERKFADCKILALYPSEFEGDAWAVVHEYASPSPETISSHHLKFGDIWSAGCVGRHLAAECFRQLQPKEHYFVVYPVAKEVGR